MSAGDAAVAPHVRPAGAGDAAAIRRVHQAAFPGGVEADLVEALAELTQFSLVATSRRRVVGHVLVSRATVDTGLPILVLAPVGVRPEAQGRGIGSALCRSVVELSRHSGFALLSVLGERRLYERFGFERARPLGILPPFEVPDAAWQVLRLPGCPEGMRGTVEYPRPWAAFL